MPASLHAKDAVPGLSCAFDYLATTVRAVRGDGSGQQLIGRLPRTSLSRMRVVSWTTERAIPGCGLHATALARGVPSVLVEAA